jgi:ribosomal protein L6P/L9E
MKKKIEEMIEIPAGVVVEYKDGEIVLKGKGKELKRKFVEHPKIKVSVEGSKIKIACEKTTKKEMKLIGSLVAHIKNNLK